MKILTRTEQVGESLKALRGLRSGRDEERSDKKADSGSRMEIKKNERECTGKPQWMGGLTQERPGREALKAMWKGSDKKFRLVESSEKRIRSTLRSQMCMRTPIRLAIEENPQQHLQTKRVILILHGGPR